MKPRRVPTANKVFRLAGGNEDNDLWVESAVRDSGPIIVSVWELDEAERATIAAGGTIELIVFGVGHPPVSLDVGPSLEERRS